MRKRSVVRGRTRRDGVELSFLGTSVWRCWYVVRIMDDCSSRFVIHLLASSFPS